MKMVEGYNSTLVENYHKRLDKERRFYYYLGVCTGVIISVLFGILPLKDNVKRLEQMQVNLEQKPLLEDKNGDGLADLVLKLNSGDELILYKTNGRYQFNDPRRR